MWLPPLLPLFFVTVGSQVPYLSFVLYSVTSCYAWPPDGLTVRFCTVNYAYTTYCFGPFFITIHVGLQNVLHVALFWYERRDCVHHKLYCTELAHWLQPSHLAKMLSIVLVISWSISLTVAFWDLCSVSSRKVGNMLRRFCKRGEHALRAEWNHLTSRSKSVP